MGSQLFKSDVEVVRLQGDRSRREVLVLGRDLQAHVERIP